MKVFFKKKHSYFFETDRTGEENDKENEIDWNDSNKKKSTDIRIHHHNTFVNIESRVQALT